VALGIADAAALVEADAPVQLTPDGLFRARDGRPEKLPGWHMDAAIAATLLERLRERQNPIVIDYEHQTLTAAESGHPAPAAGWMDPAGIEYRPGQGLFAAVRWTARAAAMIAAREIAFLSPVLLYSPTTGAVLDIHSAAVTNTPAVHGMRPLAELAERLGYVVPTLTPPGPPLPSRGEGGESPRLPAGGPSHPEDTPMDLAALRSLLGLPDDADEAAILKAIADTKSQAGQVAALTEQLTTAKLAAEAAATPDPKAWVPVAVHQEALAALRTRSATADATELAALIEGGLKAGQIPGQATADWLRRQGPAAVRAYLEGAPAIAALKTTQTGGHTPAGADGAKPKDLAEEELAVCTQMGLDPAAYLATRTVLFPSEARA
jgi:phage I-like protein